MNKRTKADRDVQATILIVEQHDLVRDTLREWLGTIFAGCSFLAANSGEDALELVSAALPDLILMDIELTAINGIEATRRIKAAQPGARIVVLSSHEDQHYRRDAEAAGACAYLNKRTLPADLPPVMRRLLLAPFKSHSSAPQSHAGPGDSHRTQAGDAVDKRPRRFG